jgi:lysophospholipase L1-like esterase
VVALPGARAEDVFNRLMRRQIRLANYQLIICTIGTNDVASKETSATLVAEGIMTLMWVIRRANPTAILVVSGMLIRKADLGTPVEYKRRLVNTIVQRRCRVQGVKFWKAWKCLMTRSEVRRGVYAMDNLHLNRSGARIVYKFLEGNITNLEGGMRL